MSTRTVRPVAPSNAVALNVANSGRGQYTWLGEADQPPTMTGPDVYYRDQVTWASIEPTPGHYHFTAFDQGLREAAAHHGKFGFRVMAWCPGCSFATTPTWMPTQPGTLHAPDWNSPTFLSRWAALIRALGHRYANDPRLGWVDVGGYGAWGEWHTWIGNGPYGTPITDTHARTLISDVLTAFPHQHVLVNASDQHLAELAVRDFPRIGMRVDCLGAPNMLSALPYSPLLQARWHTQPLITEWCSGTDSTPTAGLAQIRRYHVAMTSGGNLTTPYADMSPTQQTALRHAVAASGFNDTLTRLTTPTVLHRTAAGTSAAAVTVRFANRGVAPTYDRWTTRIALLDPTGRPVATGPLGVDLRTLLPGSRTYTRTPSFHPTSSNAIPAGRYRVAVAVTDPTRYLPPLHLALPSRTSRGWYPVSTVTVQ